MRNDFCEVIRPHFIVVPSHAMIQNNTPSDEATIKLMFVSMINLDALDIEWEMGNQVGVFHCGAHGQVNARSIGIAVAARTSRRKSRGPRGRLLQRACTPAGLTGGVSPRPARRGRLVPGMAPAAARGKRQQQLARIRQHGPQA